eukprot:scaffold35233_cov72-Phaeocystis_antarctica.AAC.2
MPLAARRAARRGHLGRGGHPAQRAPEHAHIGYWNLAKRLPWPGYRNYSTEGFQAPGHRGLYARERGL